MSYFPGILSGRRRKRGPSVRREKEPILWTSGTSSFGTTTVRSVAYGTTNDVWTVVGDSGKLATANVATGTWTQRTTAFTGSTIFGAARGADNYWVLSATDHIAYVADATTAWIDKGNPFDGPTDMRAVAYGDSYWVVGGERTGPGDARLATAATPSGTWTVRDTGMTSYGIYGIAQGEGYWVACGENGYLSIATGDPTSWVLKTDAPFAGSGIMTSIAYGDDGYWVAVGTAGRLATSTNPTGVWTMQTSSFAADRINSVAYGNGAWVAVGNDGKIATAEDPTGVWTQRDSHVSGSELYGVSYDDECWVAVGENGVLTTSST